MACGKYSAGMLKDVVAIQAKARASDGMGGFAVSWAAVSGAPTRASISAAPGAEKWGFMRQVPGNTYKMVTRYFSGASAAQRVICDGKEFAVLGVVKSTEPGDWLEWRLSDGVAS